MTRAAPQVSPVATPVSRAERLWALDALRGLALFGVLAINLHTEFRVSFFEQFLAPPPRPFVDSATATFLAFAFEFKAIALFSILFGIGLAIQHERLAQNPRRLVLLLRRLTALLAFGLIHLYLVWNGDILTEYAIAGLMALPLLFMRSSLYLLAAVILLLIYIGMPWLPLPFSFPDPIWITSHAVEARQTYGTGTFIEILRFRIAEVPQLAKLHIYIFPRTLALILFGAWLYRSGALRRLGEHAAALLIVGLVLIGLGMFLTAQEAGHVSLINAGPIADSAMRVLAPLLVANGYAALALAANGNDRARAALLWAVPVGRMAFSNYTLQSIVLGLLFYGYGSGLMGHVGPAVGLGIAIAIYSVQAWVSRRWLRTHRFGPLEWLWRSLMYGKRQPWWTGSTSPAASCRSDAARGMHR